MRDQTTTCKRGRESPLSSALCAIQLIASSMRRWAKENTFRGVLLTSCQVITTIYELYMACLASSFGRMTQHLRSTESGGEERRLWPNTRRLEKLSNNYKSPDPNDHQWISYVVRCFHLSNINLPKFDFVEAVPMETSQCARR